MHKYNELLSCLLLRIERIFIKTLLYPKTQQKCKLKKILLKQTQLHLSLYFETSLQVKYKTRDVLFLILSRND